MNISDAKVLCELHMENHGLIAKGWKYVLNTRIKRSAGLCRFGRQTIEIGSSFIELNDEKEIENTILHECAHCLVGPGQGHNWLWRMKAREIGCNGERTTDAKASHGKYQGTCEKCGNVFSLYKRPKRPEARRHHIGCGGEVKFDFGI